MIAAEQAISSPLLEAGGVRGARGVLINITGSSRLGLHEVNDACELIRKAAENDDVQINFGIVLDESMEDEVKITVIATGFERESLPSIRRTGVKVTDSVAQRAMPEPEPQMELPQVAAEDGAEKEGTGAAPPPLTMAASANTAQTNGSHEPVINELDVPAILRRRMM